MQEPPFFLKGRGGVVKLGGHYLLALYGLMPVCTRTFREIWEPLVRKSSNISGEIRMDQSLGAWFSRKICMDQCPFPLRLALVHGWHFPEQKGFCLEGGMVLRSSLKCWAAKIEEETAFQDKAQIKLTKNFSVKNFAPPKKASPKNSLCLGFFLCFEGTEVRGPKHKEFTWSGVSWREWSRRGVSGEILYGYAFFSGPDKNPRKPSQISKSILETLLLLALPL